MPTYRALGAALLCVSLASCALFKPKMKEAAEGDSMPATVAVVPIDNQSQDITMPVLVRYFLEKELDSKGFSVPLVFNETDDALRQMGITNGSQVNDGNIRNIGQSLKVDGVMQGTLYEVSMIKGVKVLRASFRLVSVFSGRTLWEKQMEIEQKVGDRLPVKGTVTTEWTLKQVRSIARSRAGKIPKKLVRNALKTLKH